MDFNVNQYIKVKLTDVGKVELKRQHNELRKVCASVGEYSPKEEDEDGFVKFQAWSLFSSLGHLCNIGCNPPFETDVKIEVNENG